MHADRIISRNSLHFHAVLVEFWLGGF